MTIHSTTGNCFRTTPQLGIRQRIARRRPLDFPGGIQLWQAVGKVLLWTIPLVLSLNLLFSSMTNSYRLEIEATHQAIAQQEKEMDELLLKTKRLTAPVRVKIAAAEKLGLHEPEPNQIKHM